MYLSEVRPFVWFQFTDVFHVRGVESNLLSLVAMEAKGFTFHGKNSEISLFGGKLVFPVKGNLYKVLGFSLPMTREDCLSVLNFVRYRS